MLKLNTVLTGLAVVLMGVLGFIGEAMWNDVKDTKTQTTAITTDMTTVKQTLGDHETRIRQAEHDVTILQQQEREDNHRAASPKMKDGNQNQ